MANQMEIYNKSESILEIRQDASNQDVVHDRIRRLHSRLGDPGGSEDYRTRIIRKACDEMLGDSKPTNSSFTLQQHVVEEISRLSDEELPRYLFYRYRYDVFPKINRADEFPPCLQIEPASICNYRCVFCYQTDTELTNPKNGHMGLMSLDLFKSVVDQAQGMCEAVTLASRGEPLICPDIDDMLAYVSGKFLALKINTNAWFLDERKSHSILQAGVNTLVFSADAAAEPLYSELRVNGSLDRVVASIEQFQDIRMRHYPDSRLISRVSGVRYSPGQDMDDMQEFWGGLVDQVAFVDYNPWENTYQRSHNDIATPCSDLWRRMFVWFDGMINPCDVDYLSILTVGNANDEHLSEVWSGDKYEALRRAHLDNQRSSVSPCNRCTVV